MHAIPKLEDPGGNLKDMVLLIHQLNHLEQPGQFDDLAYPANLYNTNHAIDVLRFRTNEKKFEGYDSNHVYDEPAMNIIASNYRDVIHNFEIFVVECRQEDDKYVNKEYDIEHVVEYVPAIHIVIILIHRK